MATKTPWANLKSEFCKLLDIPEARRLKATRFEGEWSLSDWPWPLDPKRGEKFEDTLKGLVTRGIELTDKDGWSNPKGWLDLLQWLDLLLAEGHGKRIITGDSSESYYIQDVIQASIEYCAVMDERPSNAALVQAQSRSEDFEIIFFNEREARVRINGKVENMTLSEMGLADRRRIDHPDKQGEMLLALAQGGGIIPRERRIPDHAESLDKYKDRLCAALKKRFGIPSNSIKLTPEGYVAQFKVSVAPGFTTDDIE